MYFKEIQIFFLSEYELGNMLNQDYEIYKKAVLKELQCVY